MNLGNTTEPHRKEKKEEKEGRREGEGSVWRKGGEGRRERREF